MPFRTVKARLDKLEERADVTDERLDAAESWLGDESTLREIDEARIALLERADKIHERRIRGLRRDLKRQARSK